MRELDALIAEKVMGGFVNNPDELAKTAEVWFWVHPKDGVLIGRPWLLSPDDDPDQTWDHSWEKWQPSTDIAAAFNLWTRLEEMGYAVSLRTVRDESNSKFCADLMPMGPRSQYSVPDRSYHAWAPTAPQAVAAVAYCTLEGKSTIVWDEIVL